MKALLLMQSPVTAFKLQLAWQAGFPGSVCIVAESVEEFQAHAEHYFYHACIISANAVRGELCERVRVLRVKYPRIAIVVLGPNHDESVQCVAALHAGADNYLPFEVSFGELSAVLRAIVRRHYGHAQDRIDFGRVVVDILQQQLFVDDKLVYLTRSLYKTLLALALNKGNHVSRGALIEALYDSAREPEWKIFDVWICKLRKILREALHTSENPIECVWRHGWRLKEFGHGAD